MGSKNLKAENCGSENQQLFEKSLKSAPAIAEIPCALHRQLARQLISDAFDFRPGAALGVIPDNLQRIPSIFWPSRNLVE